MSQEPSNSFEAEYHMAWMCRDLTFDPDGTYMLVQAALNRLLPQEEKNPTTVNLDELTSAIRKNLMGIRDKSHWAREVLYRGLILQTPIGYHKALGQVLERKHSSDQDTYTQIQTRVTDGFILAWTLMHWNEKNPSYRTVESGFLFSHSMSPEQINIKEALIVWKAKLYCLNGKYAVSDYVMRPRSTKAKDKESAKS